MNDWRRALGERLVTAEAAVARVRFGRPRPLPAGSRAAHPRGGARGTARRARGVRGRPGRDRVPARLGHGHARLGRADRVRHRLHHAARSALPRGAPRRFSGHGLRHRIARRGGRTEGGWAADVLHGGGLAAGRGRASGFGYGPWHAKALLAAAKLSIARWGRALPGTRRRQRAARGLRPGRRVARRAVHPAVGLPRARPGAPRGRRSGGRRRRRAGERRLTRSRSGRERSRPCGSLPDRQARPRRRFGDLVPSAIELVKCGAATRSLQDASPGRGDRLLLVPGADMAFCHEQPPGGALRHRMGEQLPRIAAIANLVAINQAVAIDLTGQVASESMGARHVTPAPAVSWSGRWCALFARGGRAVHVLPSTARGDRSRASSRSWRRGRSSPCRARRRLRRDEYGVANLQGRTQRERALALVDLAHPRFRDEAPRRGPPPVLAVRLAAERRGARYHQGPLPRRRALRRHRGGGIEEDSTWRRSCRRIPDLCRGTARVIQAYEQLSDALPHRRAARPEARGAREARHRGRCPSRGGGTSHIRRACEAGASATRSVTRFAWRSPRSGSRG